MLAHRIGAGVPVKVVHLVRDPRGFYYSWRNNVGPASPKEIGRRWATQHAGIEALAAVAPNIRVYRVRYEDLCKDPQTVMERIFDFLGVPRENVLGPPRYPVKHHLMGNKMLFSFDGTVRLDTQWRAVLSPSEQGLVARAAGSAIVRYGYGEA